MNIEVRADLPPETHPDALANLARPLDQEGTIGRAAYHEARDALGTAYSTLAAIADAERALHEHAQATEPARRRQHPDGRSTYLGNLRMQDGRVRQFVNNETEFAAAADATLQRATQALDRRGESLGRHKAALEERVAAALKPKQAAHVQQEIRAYVRSLPDDQRLDFLGKAASAGDRDTIGAVLEAPTYLSGLSAESSETIRAKAAQALAGTDYAQAQAVQSALDAVNRAGGRLVTKVGELEKYRNGTAARVGKAVDNVRKVGA
mgnify:CR=1 FL=1